MKGRLLTTIVRKYKGQGVAGKRPVADIPPGYGINENPHHCAQSNKKPPAEVGRLSTRALRPSTKLYLGGELASEAGVEAN